MKLFLLLFSLSMHRHFYFLSTFLDAKHPNITDRFSHSLTRAFPDEVAPCLVAAHHIPKPDLMTHPPPPLGRMFPRGSFPEDFSQKVSCPEGKFPRRKFPRRTVSQKDSPRRQFPKR